MSVPVPDGGPAFPQVRTDITPGMSLRDYFAAKAIPAMLANIHDTQVANIRNGIAARVAEAETVRALGQVASAAYAIADDMLAVRAKRVGA